MPRKTCQLKRRSLSQFPFGNIVSLVHFLYFLQQNDVISQSHKIVDNLEIKQGITKL